MESELLWLVAGIGLLVAEVLTLTVVLGMLGVGALVAALAALLGGPLLVQALVFAGTSAALLSVRPAVQRRLTAGSDDVDRRTDPRALTGSTAVVVEAVTDESGQVRLGGELWRARPYAGTGPVDVGREVSVGAVEGATLLVYSSDLT